MILKTWTGRELRVTTEVDWNRGRVFYAVTGVGTFTFERDPWAATDERANSLYVYYGRHEGDGYPRQRLLPEAPVLFGVTLRGACGFDPEALASATGRTEHFDWRVDREGGFEAPRGTRKRVHEICGALVTHYLTREDYAQIEHARAAHLAPARLRQHAEKIAELRGIIRGAELALAAELRAADAQAALTAPMTAAV